MHTSPRNHLRKRRLSGFQTSSLLAIALAATLTPATALAVSSTGTASAGSPSAPAGSCTLNPQASDKSELPASCVIAGVTLDRVPAVGESATVTVTLDTEVTLDRAQLAIRLPQHLRITSEGFSAPQERAHDTVSTRELSLDPTGATVTFTVTADAEGPAQIQADVTDAAAPAAERSAHASAEITVGTTAGTSREGVRGKELVALRKDGTELRATRAAGKGADASAQVAAGPGEVCATGTLQYATYDGAWHAGKRFPAVLKGQETPDGPTVELARGTTGATDGTYELCGAHQGPPLATMWVEFSTKGHAWEVVDMAGVNGYTSATAPLTDVPAGTTQSFGTTTPNPLHMRAFDAYDVINKIFDVRGSGTDCWTVRQTTNCDKLSARWAPGNPSGGWYDPSLRAVFLSNSMPDNRHVTLHEAGHNHQHLLSNWFQWGNDCPSPHYIAYTGGGSCAWFEGYANAINGYLLGDGRFYYAPAPGGFFTDLMQTGFGDPTIPRGNDNFENGDYVEGRVAGAIITLWRELEGGPEQTFRNMAAHPSDTFREWFTIDRPKSGLPVGKAAQNILYDFTIDYRDVKRQESLVNGSLEDQGAGWTWDNGVVGSYSGYQARTGRQYVWMGGNGVASTDTLSQTLKIPARGDTALEFWMRVVTQDTATVPEDLLKLQFEVDGQTLTYGQWSNRERRPTYAKHVIDLSRLAGKTVTMKLVSTEDDGGRTDFVMDDFSVYTTR